MTSNIKFTPIEWKIYQFILANKNKIPNFSLRQLALKLNVAPASVVRTIKKMGYSHYKDLCKKIIKDTKMADISDDITYQARYYFNQPLMDIYSEKIKLFRKLTINCDDFIFFGVGTSGDLAAYGARQFSNNGKNAFVIKDPFFPVQQGKDYSRRAIMVLSVSGETEQTISQIISFMGNSAKVISITNNSDNTIANLSDLNFSYFLESKIVGRKLNLTSQIPVVYILERLSRSLQD